MESSVRGGAVKIFKIEAEGDTIYLQAETLAQAKVQLENKMGQIPEELLTWTEIKKLPKGEEFI
jgi:hypothetical protein